ncbi:hypothetical protein BpHYR1_042693 [Brachionus plicatilis]|uniref:Uncharacterized protein n=1 Tax=Brachionus plicatilis TaxID=10195 RepID=A0A3M7SIV3_BRAPC|nr:hypothetical protein BpHYR1_042693 [Brachionus plicatilis]
MTLQFDFIRDVIINYVIDIEIKNTNTELRSQCTLIKKIRLVCHVFLTWGCGITIVPSRRILFEIGSCVGGSSESDSS